MLKVNSAAWQRQIGLQTRLVLDRSEATVNEAGEELKQRIEDRTPVGNPSLWSYPAHTDYTPGYLKGNWKLTTNGQTILIDNDAPYAERVENGWSSQAPQGMMRVSVMEFPDILKQIALKNKL